jgi:hypothetical protein
MQQFNRKQDTSEMQYMRCHAQISFSQNVRFHIHELYVHTVTYGLIRFPFVSTIISLISSPNFFHYQVKIPE